MAEMILDTEYWKRRIERAPRDEPHKAVFLCPRDRWERIEEKHRGILAKLIQPRDSILDAGCGWGRLLSLMPKNWDGRYLGVDLSPDFIKMAQEKYPKNEFERMDLQLLGEIPDTFDWVVMISMKKMIIRNLGWDTWERIEAQLRIVTNKVLFLEYDELDEGETFELGDSKL